MSKASHIDLTGIHPRNDSVIIPFAFDGYTAGNLSVFGSIQNCLKLYNLIFCLYCGDCRNNGRDRADEVQYKGRCCHLISAAFLKSCICGRLPPSKLRIATYSEAFAGAEQRGGNDKVCRTVNIDGAGGGHSVRVAAASIQAAGAEEVLRFHEIDGTVHTVVGLQLLPALIAIGTDERPHAAVRREGVAPERRVLHLADGNNAFSLLFLHHAEGRPDIISGTQGRGGLKEHEGVKVLPHFLVAAQHLPNGVLGGSGIGGGLGAAEERLVRAVLPGDAGVALRIGGNVNGVEQPGGEGRFDGICQQGLAVQRLDVFVRQALGAAAGGNDGDGTHGASLLHDRKVIEGFFGVMRGAAEKAQQLR